jgi:hypothetical protein
MAEYRTFNTAMWTALDRLSTLSGKDALTVEGLPAITGSCRIFCHGLLDQGHQGTQVGDGLSYHMWIVTKVIS